MLYVLDIRGIDLREVGNHVLVVIYKEVDISKVNKRVDREVLLVFHSDIQEKIFPENNQRLNFEKGHLYFCGVLLKAKTVKDNGIFVRDGSTGTGPVVVFPLAVELVQIINVSENINTRDVFIPVKDIERNIMTSENN